jgi:hypothetical protein
VECSLGSKFARFWTGLLKNYKNVHIQLQYDDISWDAAVTFKMT